MNNLPEKRSVVVAGHQTSVSLEKPFWEALTTIAQNRGMSLNSVITTVDRTRSGNLSSALRLYVLNEYQKIAKNH